jgi:predicted metal-binding protein
MRDEICPWKTGVVLICKNQRGPGASRPSCGETAGHELKSWLKNKARAGGGGLAEARILTTSCLDICPVDGVTVAVEPGAKIMVVDADHDREALLQMLQSHFDSPRSPDSGGGLARRALSRLRKS